MSKSLNWKQILVSLASAMALVALYYTTGSLKPFLHDTPWRPFHWICYFWVALLLPWLIWKLYDRLVLGLRDTIAEIGRWSYEIFLLQMFVFTAYPRTLLDTGNPYINVAMCIIFTTCASIIPVIVYKRWQSRRKLIVNKH